MNRAKRVLVIAPTPFFADRGCHVRIYEEILALQQLGDEVLLCTYGLGRDVPGIEIVRTVKLPWYHKLDAGPSLTKILLIPLLLFTVVGTARHYRPQIVHAHLHEGAIIARLMKPFFSRATYFVDIQGSLVGELKHHRFIPPSGIIVSLFRTIEKITLSWFPILTQSRMLANGIARLGVPSTQVHVVGDGVDPARFDPFQSRAEIGFDAPRVQRQTAIIYMGLLTTYQGVDLLLRAFASVKEMTSIPVKLLIIGYPNVEYYTRMAKELGIDRDVTFFGKINYSKVARYLSLGDIAVSSKISVAEGDGKLYNYLAMGLPVVAFDRPVTREIVGDAGIIVPIGDVKAMAGAIVDLLNDSDKRKRLSSKARNRAEKELSWTSVAHRIERVYEQYLT